jgi:hypothetical protein
MAIKSIKQMTALQLIKLIQKYNFEHEVSVKGKPYYHLNLTDLFHRLKLECCL